jgi:hypothetical protein
MCPSDGTHLGEEKREKSARFDFSLGWAHEWHAAGGSAGMPPAVFEKEELEWSQVPAECGDHITLNNEE